MAEVKPRNAGSNGPEPGPVFEGEIKTLKPWRKHPKFFAGVGKDRLKGGEG